MAAAVQVAVYRFCAALSSRPWFAHELCNHGKLFQHILDPTSASGKLCQWRYSTVLALCATAAAAASRVDGGHGEGLDSVLAAFLPELQSSKASGPYRKGVTSDNDEGALSVATMTL
jgi:hypothetical protein